MTDVEAPVCYRHTDREAHVRCVRCNRRICPDCMVSAAVGFQCRDCLREGGRTIRQGRTTFGGRVVSDTALVTKMLIGINVAVFIFGLLAGDAFIALFVQRAGLPAAGIPGVATGEWYRLLTAAFLHGGLQPAFSLLHIAMNMYVLWIFGPQLERLLGPGRYLVLYLLSALGGSLASYAFNHPLQGSLGASGAIFGLVGATFVVMRRLRANTSGLVAYIGLIVVFGFMMRGVVDWKAHLGGLIVGAVVAAAFAYAPRERRLVYQSLAVVVVLALIVGGVLLRTVQLSGATL